jgi:hypothetical protein
VNNYQNKTLPSYNMPYLRYVSQDAQTVMPEDVSVVNSRSVYILMFSNLIFIMSSVCLWFLRVLLYSSTCALNLDVVQQKRQKTPQESCSNHDRTTCSNPEQRWVAHIPDARSPWRLIFVYWCLIFEDPWYGSCFMSPF